MRSSGQERFGRLGTWVAIVFMAIVLTGCTCCYVEQAYPVAACLPPDCCGMSPCWNGQVLAPGWAPAPNVPYPPSATGRAVDPSPGPRMPTVVDQGGPAGGGGPGPGGPGPTHREPYPIVCVCVVNQTNVPVPGHVILHCQNGPVDVPVIPPIPQGGHKCWPINPPCLASAVDYNLGVCHGTCTAAAPPGPVTLIVCAQGGGVIGPVVCDCVLVPGPCPPNPRQFCPPYHH